MNVSDDSIRWVVSQYRWPTLADAELLNDSPIYNTATPTTTKAPK